MAWNKYLCHYLVNHHKFLLVFYLIFLIVLYLLLCFTLAPLFVKAGVDPKLAWIPGRNFRAMCRIVGENPSRAWWLLFPVYNIFVYCGLCVDMVRSYGKYRLWHSALAVFYAPIIFWMIGKNKSDKYVGPTVVLEKDFHDKFHEAHAKGDKAAIRKLEANNPYHKGHLREWAEAAFFAIYAASFIRMFLIEAYQIPTSSMEGSLLIGDYLFVSKAHYGIRTPKTLLMAPLVHNRMPFFDGESYLAEPGLPYFRLPKFQSIDHNDPVVFNYPEGDSVYFDPERTFSIYDERRNPGVAQIVQGKKLVVRPLDKMDHYIKRCVGLPGDELKIINRQVFINGKPARNPANLQYKYIVDDQGKGLNTSSFYDWGISAEDMGEYEIGKVMVLNQEQIDKVKAMDLSIKVTPFPDSLYRDMKVWPYSPTSAKWTVDNYGPVRIPKKGETIQLNRDNINMYRRAISVYEGNKLQERDGQFIINGKASPNYTFKLDYYWMMGDNRHNSEDARFWGFVPETHVVGKPLFIWFSTKDATMSHGIRWNRLFTSAHRM